MKDIDEILREIVFKTVEKANPKESPKGTRQCLKIDFWDNRRNPDPMRPTCRADGFEIFVLLPYWITSKGRTLYLYNPDKGIDDDVFGWKTSEILELLGQENKRQKIPSYDTRSSLPDYNGQVDINCLYFDAQGNRLPDDHWRTDPHNWGPMGNPPVFSWSKETYRPVSVPMYIKKGEKTQDWLTTAEANACLKER